MVNVDRSSFFVVFNPNGLHSIVMDLFSLVIGLTYLWMPLVALWSYIYWNDKCLTTIPRSALSLSPKRWRPTDARMLEEKLSNSHVPIKALPTKTGRRYIIVGGGGFLGAWIATKLLERGEDPHNIRLLDLNMPANHTVANAIPKGMQFITVDITNSVAVEAAFRAPWTKSAISSSSSLIETAITVFHTAANIRFFERHLELFDRSTKVNVIGTQNVINAACKVGVDVMIYTSSASVGLRNLRLFFWPWEKESSKLVQIVTDDDTQLPKRHEDFFSNYAASKFQAEAVVRASDNLPTGDTANKTLRTGCLRPGNAIFGPRGDMNCGAWLVRQFNPTWATSTVQSFTYVENCVAAHLCYEARLIELQAGSKNPDIGGQAFAISDAGPPPTYGDMYTIMETLTDGQCTFPHLSPTMMMILAHLIEWYYRTQQSFVRRGSRFASLMPALKGDLVILQPSIFPLVLVHLIIDDSRARLSPDKGGLGYEGSLTSTEGLYQTIDEYRSGVGLSDQRSDGAGFGLFRFWGKKPTKVKESRADNLVDAVPQFILTEISNPP